MVQKSPVSGAGLLPCLVICRSTSILRGTVRLLVLNRNNRRRNLSASVCVVFFFFFLFFSLLVFWGGGVLHKTSMAFLSSLFLNSTGQNRFASGFSCIIACTGGSVLFVCLFLLCLLLCYIVTILYFYSFNTKSSSSSGENLQPHQHWS